MKTTEMKAYTGDSYEGQVYKGSSFKNTVSDLCQSDRHFLAFSDTTRNERHRKSN